MSDYEQAETYIFEGIRSTQDSVTTKMNSICSRASLVLDIKYIDPFLRQNIFRFVSTKGTEKIQLSGSIPTGIKSNLIWSNVEFAELTNVINDISSGKKPCFRNSYLTKTLSSCFSKK